MQHIDKVVKRIVKRQKPKGRHGRLKSTWGKDKSRRGCQIEGFPRAERRTRDKHSIVEICPDITPSEKEDLWGKLVLDLNYIAIKLKVKDVFCCMLDPVFPARNSPSFRKKNNMQKQEESHHTAKRTLLIKQHSSRKGSSASRPL